METFTNKIVNIILLLLTKVYICHFRKQRQSVDNKLIQIRKNHISFPPFHATKKELVDLHKDKGKTRTGN